MIWSVNINVADIRAEPKFRSERISQALFNEVLQVNGEKDGYYKIQCRDGYEGWIAAQFVTEHSGFPEEVTYIVNAHLAPGFADAAAGSARRVYLPYGSGLYGKENKGFLIFSSDRYGVIHVPLAETLKLKHPAKPFLPDRNELIREAGKFLSAPYLWGGRSFFGIDCSGFVQTMARRFGVELPRDSKDQIKFGAGISRDEVRHGDLLFFPRHVALAVSDKDFIHSSSRNGGVAYNSLDSKSALYSEYYHREFKTARRIFE
jgi:hypothetical protein